MNALEQEVRERSGVPITSLMLFREVVNGEYELTMNYRCTGEAGFPRQAKFIVPMAEAQYLGEAGMLDLAVLALRENYVNGNDK